VKNSSKKYFLKHEILKIISQSSAIALLMGSERLFGL